MSDEQEGIKQWKAKDGSIIIDKGNGERIFVKPDRDDPSTAGKVYESGLDSEDE